VEELAWYGLYVYWNEDARAAYVWPGTIKPGGGGETEYPSYVQPAPAGRVGDPAEVIYASDVRTFVAGEEKECFNIGGHVLIYLSDLSPYGDVVWDPAEKTAGLTVAADPVELALDREEAELKSYLLTCYFDRYPGPRGTLAVYGQSGTPHGSSCSMLYIDRSGKQTQLNDLLPRYGFGTEYYLRPRDIRFDEAGDTLTFITPVKEVLDWEAGTAKDWGDTLCVFSTQTGQMVSMTPLDQGLSDWSAGRSTYDGGDAAWDMSMEVSFVRGPGEYQVTVTEAQIPRAKLNVTASSDGISIVQELDLENSGRGDGPYEKGMDALRALDLPDITRENYSAPDNTPEQREQAAQWFRVTKNGEPVSGDLWWSQGNNHRDLNFSFDRAQVMAEGDVLTVWIGVPD